MTVSDHKHKTDTTTVVIPPTGQNSQTFGSKVAKLDGVEWVELGEVAEIRRGEVVTIDQLNGHSRPVFSSNSPDKPWGYADKTRLSFGKKTIIITGHGGNVGKINYPNLDDFTCTQTVIAITVNDQLDAKYVYFFLRNVDLVSVARKRAIERANDPVIFTVDLAKLRIPLLPLKVQQQLVAKTEEKERITEANNN